MALAVAASMLLWGAASAGIAGPPYRGTAVPTIFFDSSGCAKGKVVQPNFSLHTGVGHVGVTKAAAKSCGPANFATTSDVFSEAILTANLQLKIPAGVHNVTPTVLTTWAGSASIKVPGSCPSLPFTNDYFYNETSLFGYFDLYWSNNTGVQSNCYTDANINLVADIFLVDVTNGTDVPITYGPGCDYFSIDCYSTSVYNDSNAYNSTYYDQYNDTNLDASGYTYTNGSGGFNSSSATSWTSFSGSGSGSASPSFIYDFAHGHVYYLEVSWYASAIVESVGWPGASATATLNVATLGNGVSIPHVVIV